MDQIEPEFVENLFSEGKTYKEVQLVLQNLFPGERGFSIISIKRYCHKHALSPRVQRQAVQEMVSQSVEEVGPTFGRKMMKGYIQQKYNVKIGQNRIANALATVAPTYNQRRRSNTARLMNPIPYRADYFGHKLHLDQNEKLVMYGVTHVIAIDGHSRFIVAGTTMPVKNNVVIYNEIYRKSLIDFGMFHQVRVDGGKEFYLSLGIQETFANLRSNQNIAPYRQTQSKKNLPVERIWPEVNSRVNYPIKLALVEMDNNLEIDMDNDAFRFCVSTITCRVANFGLRLVISSWNEHPIPGRGVPSVIKSRTNQLQPLLSNDIPEGIEAKDLYERTYSGRITEESHFGVDPLVDSPVLIQQREVEFEASHAVQTIYHNIVNGRSSLFKNAIKDYIRITSRLSS